MDDWKTNQFPFGYFAYFQVRTVSFREGKSHPPFPKIDVLVLATKKKTHLQGCLSSSCHGCILTDSNADLCVLFIERNGSEGISHLDRVEFLWLQRATLDTLWDQRSHLAGWTMDPGWVDVFPIKNGDIPATAMLGYQRVHSQHG